MLFLEPDHTLTLLRVQFLNQLLLNILKSFIILFVVCRNIFLFSFSSNLHTFSFSQVIDAISNEVDSQNLIIYREIRVCRK
jgi:hypothetical protein